MKKYNLMIFIIVFEILVIASVFWYILDHSIKGNDIILITFTFSFAVTNLSLLAFLTLRKMREYFLDKLVELEVIKAKSSIDDFSDDVAIINHEVFRNLQLIQIYVEKEEYTKIDELLK